MHVCNEYRPGSLNSSRAWLRLMGGIACVLIPVMFFTSGGSLGAAPQKKGGGRGRPERGGGVRERSQPNVRDRGPGDARGPGDRGPGDARGPGDRDPGDARGPADARARAQGFARPDVSPRINAYWNQVGAARRPFTVGWYRSHPSAWRFSFAARRPWGRANYSAIARFVGLTGGPVAYSYDNPSAWTSSQWSAVAAATKTAEPASDEDLMPLGVYSLLPPDASDSNTMVQLNITKDGAVVGSYYDMLSDNGQPVSGSLDRETQRVFWTIGENSDVAFESGLEYLTNDSAPVTVHMKDGDMQKWTMVRVNDASAPESP